jgi:hypothetical protein
MSSHELRAHSTARVTQVHTDLGQRHATVLQAGCLLSQVVGSDPARATKLIIDQGQAVTDVGDLKAEAFQLTYALSAIETKGSAQGVFVPPPASDPPATCTRTWMAAGSPPRRKLPSPSPARSASGHA